MWAASPGPGKGATFTFELPLVPAFEAMPMAMPMAARAA